MRRTGVVAMSELERGVVIVLVGIAGVFANLLVIMSVISLIGRVFGKKKKPAAAPKPASDSATS